MEGAGLHGRVRKLDKPGWRGRVGAMFVVTHALSPVVLAAIGDVALLEARGERWLRRRQYVGIALAGALPDVLWPHLSLAARLNSPTHTVWFWLLVAVVAFCWAGRFFGGERGRLLGVLMTLACGWHLFCDGIANGIRWGYPVFDSVVGVRLVPYRWWLGLDIGCVVIVCLLMGWLRWREGKLKGTW